MRIGIFMGKVYKETNSRMLTGILEEAFSRGISAYVFTLNDESNNPAIAQGEENLVSIINFELLDGVIFLPYTFSSQSYWDHIEQFLTKNCTKPVVRVGMEFRPFSPIWFSDRADIAEVVRHLIREHGCRELLCLTGPEDQKVSHERVSGFRDALTEAGLPCPEENIIYGDFYIFTAQALAQELAEGKRPMPDAVVCANDMMAISLCDSLRGYGISVPDQVRITGFDGTLEASFHSPGITTYQPSWRQLGRNALCQLYEMMTGKIVVSCRSEQGSLLCRASCGCRSSKLHGTMKEFNYQQMEDQYLDSNLSAQLLSCNSLESFITTMYNFTFVFADPEFCDRESFCLCLCEDWNLSDTEGLPVRRSGYSERMRQMIYNGTYEQYALQDMVPVEVQEFEKFEGPTVTFFTAAHFLDRCFGCFLLTFRNVPCTLNAHYLRFCREVNNGLEFLRVQDTLKSLAYRNYLGTVRDPLTGLYKLSYLTKMWEDFLGEVRLAKEVPFWIALTVGGLGQILDVGGALERDKRVQAFSELLQNVCSHNEKCLRAGESSFLIMGSEPDSSHYHNLLLQNIKERFEQQQGEGLRLLLQASVLRGKELTGLTRDTAPDRARALVEHAHASQPTYSEQLHYADLSELRRMIYQHPEQEWSLSRCASEMSISTSYFHRIYLKAFGVSCAYDIHHSKLEYAKWLLVHTSDTLQEVSRKCGYDYSHFMRTFKKEFGMTPTEYRRGKT
ncbi:MAG: substrate-binding domain-containing protein [Oscillospiraceae bacterium]|nr:substrate-binding domain-containing protein [Oscillospiraceae bacterium]